jgi:prolyl-tRNA synthetase
MGLIFSGVSMIGHPTVMRWVRRYNHWEQKGVPLRIELGPKDVAEESVMLVRRDTNAKESCKWSALAKRVPELLEQVAWPHYSPRHPIRLAAPTDLLAPQRG